MTILLRPIMTEKSMKLASIGEYTFEIDKNTTKLQVGKEVTERFSVKVLKIKIINVKGEVKSQKRVRKSYKTTGFKKAIIKIEKNQKIAIFETPKDGSAGSPQGEAVVTTAENEPQVIKEKKDILRRTNVKVERGVTGSVPTTQRKVITGK